MIQFISVRGLTTSEQIVEYCRQQPMFRQYIQAKYLNATTTRRCYYNLTGVEVDRLAPKSMVVARAVKTLEGKFLCSLFYEYFFLNERKTQNIKIHENCIF